MKQFIGRDEDLRILDEAYTDRKFNCCAVIGRRRIGKSTLIQRFVEDKKHLYIEFVDGQPETNLRVMEAAVSEFCGSEVSYRDFVDAFGDLSRIARSEDIILVFDEFTYALSYDSFASLTKNLIDRGLGDSFLIICGSKVRMMEDEVEGYSKPLYGRTRRIDISGIGLNDSRVFHPGMSDMDLLKLHVMTGGSPYYLADTPADSLKEYFERYILPERAIFHDEGERMIRREFDPSDKYLAVMDAISVGRNDTVQISQYTHIDETTCRSILRRLEGTGIIAALNPMCGAPRKPVRYRIRDGMAAVHFKVLRGRGSAINKGYDGLSNAVNAEIGRLFEQYSMDLVSKNYPVTDIGVWYAKVPVLDEDGTILMRDGRAVTESEEIDLVAEIDDGRNRMELFAECKMRSEPMGMSGLSVLESRMAHVHGNGNRRRMLISAGGFTEDLRERAEDESVALVDMDCIFGRRPFPEL